MTSINADVLPLKVMDCYRAQPPGFERYRHELLLSFYVTYRLGDSSHFQLHMLSVHERSLLFTVGFHNS